MVPVEINVEIGARMRSFRTQRLMSQAELGRRIGVSFQQIQKYEKGVNSLNIAMLIRVANALEVTVREFLPQEGARQPLPLDEGDVKFALAFRGIRDPKTRRQLLQLVSSLSESRVSVDHAA